MNNCGSKKVCVRHFPRVCGVKECWFERFLYTKQVRKGLGLILEFLPPYRLTEWILYWVRQDEGRRRRCWVNRENCRWVLFLQEKTIFCLLLQSSLPHHPRLGLNIASSSLIVYIHVHVCACVWVCVCVCVCWPQLLRMARVELELMRAI